ncbi:MAG TPA: TIR domain-containing protein [Candidatus Saccharimonadales bacterium]|jgi:TolB-like protein/Tfp pilus assembly protein PilF|nr:TIR domain-containing protein [Candidatus Saccharimonadales bacterium]
MARDVFISHAGDDASVAVEVCALLEKRGLKCWMAPRDVAAGSVWDESILDAIETSRVFLLILSKSANDSAYVKNEVNRAFSERKPIVTFRIEDVMPGRSLQLYLARHHWTDAFPPPIADRVESLAGSIASRLTPGVNVAERATASAKEKTPSIAVLPFANMSGDKEQEYFSDGLAEEILNVLTKIPGLKVIARTSAFAFKGKNEDIRKIAEALGVSNVLEGSVRRAGNRLRITAQLIHASDGTHLWSERYDRDMTDVFAIQDEIAQAISEALKLRLTPRTQTVSIEAYQNYLKGQYYWARFSSESVAKAMNYYEQALAIDPNYALAYVGLAVSYSLLAGLGLKPVHEVVPLARSAAEKALALDPTSGEAHSSLAISAVYMDYDWKRAEEHFRQAMAVVPVSPLVRFRYVSLYLIPLGRAAEAMEQSRLALETDPLSMPLHLSMINSMVVAKQFRESIELARRALEIDPNFFVVWFLLSLAQLHLGLAQDAVISLKRVMELAPWFLNGEWWLAIAYFQAGDHTSSEEWARKLENSRTSSSSAAFYFALIGNVDAAFEAFDGAYRQRELRLLLDLHMQDIPFFQRCKLDPRFADLLRRMNLSQ